MQNKTLEKWEEKTLEDILDKGSSNLSANKLNTCEGDYPVYGASGLVKRVNFYQQEKEYLAIIKDGAGVGRVYHYEPKSSILGTLQYLFPKKNVNIRFAYYYLQSLDFAKYYQGAAIPHIYYKDYKNEKLVLPPLPEQQRIIRILDEAFEDIEKAKQNALQNLNNAKELFNYYLNKIFTMKNDWTKKNLDDVCVYKSGTTISKDLEKDFGDLLYIKVGDMNLQGNEESITTSTRFVNLKDINKNQIINNGAIIFPKRGGAIATNKKRKIIKPTIIDLNTMAISTNDEILDDYFYYWFKQINLIDISNGTTIPQINNYSFKSLKITYPVDKKEQQKIVAQLDELQEQTKKLEQIYEQKIKDLDELKQSILQKAFNGEL